jgi:allophanate hydrolase
VWRLPAQEFGPFVAEIPKPLGIGRVELDDGQWLSGFLCEQYAVAAASEITALGGWRRYLKECAQ